MSTETQLLLWALGGGFGLTYGLLAIVWSSLNNRIEKLDEKITDVDRRLCRLEGAFSAKDCCILKEDSHSKRAQ